MCYIEFMQDATEQTSAVSDVPHPRNFCGNGFPDWLEVNLTPACNAHCSWCIERNGWHPSHQAEWFTITDAAIASKRKNIIASMLGIALVLGFQTQRMCKNERS